MKKVIAAIILSSAAVMAFAEQTYDAFCGQTSDTCTLTINGKSVELTRDQLKEHMPISHSGDCIMEFCANDNGDVIGLNPEYFSEQPAQQQAAEPPYRLSMMDGVQSINPLDRAVKLVVTSTVSGLIVEKIIVNQGECMGWDRKGDLIRSSKPQLKMGGDIRVPLMGCTPIKVDIETNMGSWTHTF